MVEESPLLTLKWNHFQENFTTQFAHLKSDEDFVDVTFSCEGRLLRAHRVVLSASSPYLTALFKDNPCKHPVIILDEIPCTHLEWLLAFIYTGFVSVAEDQLPALLESANVLQIRGLADNLQSMTEINSEASGSAPKRSRPALDVTQGPAAPVPKRSAKIESRRQSRPVTMEPKPEIAAPSQEVKAEIVEPVVNEPLQSLQRIDADFGLNSSHPAQQMSEPVPHPSPTQPDWANLLSSPSQEPTEQNAEKRRHSLDPRPCPICKRHYSNQSNLRQHLRLIHNPRLVTCHLCSKTFKTELYLRRHIVGFHYDNCPPVDQSAFKHAITGTQ